MRGSGERELGAEDKHSGRGEVCLVYWAPVWLGGQPLAPDQWP